MIASIERRYARTAADGMILEAGPLDAQLRQSFASGLEAEIGFPRRPEQLQTDCEACEEDSPRHDRPPCA